jgi:hypothetical protein
VSLFVQVLQVLPIVLWKKLPRGLIDPFSPEVQRIIRLKNLISQRAILPGNPVIQCPVLLDNLVHQCPKTLGSLILQHLISLVNLLVLNLRWLQKQIQAKTALLTLSPTHKAPLVLLLLTEAHAAGLLKTEIVIVNYNKYLPDYFYKTNING